MKDLNELYFDADIPLSDGETLVKREEGIETFSADATGDAICNLAAMYYGLPTDDAFSTAFYECFASIDPIFSKQKVQELRLLAGAVLTNLSETPQPSLKASFAGLLVEINEEIPGLRNPISLEISKRILRHMDESRAALRAPKMTLDKSAIIPDVSAPASSDVQSIQALSKWSYNMFLLYQAACASFSTKLSVYREDSQILWWMTAQWCDTLDKPMKELTDLHACLLTGWEAAQMVENFPGPAAMKSVISNMISSCRGGRRKLELTDVISARSENSLQVSNQEKAWTTDFFRSLKRFPMLELLPLSSAMKRAENTSNSNEWLPKYKREVLLNADFPPMEGDIYGWMMYLECLAVQCYNALDESRNKEEEALKNA